VYRTPEAARHLSKFDAKSGYRPLKTARNLAGGWLLILPDVAAVRRALDYLYPAMLGIAVSRERGALPVVTLRETLGRQTGMYRVTQKVTDAQARETIDRFCAVCLKQRLWEVDSVNPKEPVFAPNEWPLLCHEACNLLVAEIRRVVKKSELLPGQTQA
jgi:sirohydrochlorin cobaltochelatase